MDQIAFMRLDTWLHSSKQRSISITHDNALGAHAGWEVTLTDGPREVLVTGYDDDTEDYRPLWETVNRALDKIMREG